MNKKNLYIRIGFLLPLSLLVLISSPVSAYAQTLLSSLLYAPQGLQFNVKVVVWSILFMVLLAVIVTYLKSQRNTSHKAQHPPTGVLVVSLVLLSWIFMGVWYSSTRPTSQVKEIVSVETADPLFGWEFPIARFPLTGSSPEQIAYSSVRDSGGTTRGLPVRLIIPKINVDSFIEDALITPEGRMDVPMGSDNVAWFALGPKPGSIGSAVIGGHYGMRYGKKFVFYDLDKLVIGDNIHVVDDRNKTHTFVVRRIQMYDRESDATSVFTSSDRVAHLNIVTCEGVWNKTNDTYPLRRVVFADVSTENIESVASSTSMFKRSLYAGSSGPDVVALQKFLNKKGFLKSPPAYKEGYFGTATRSALMSYQDSVGIQPIGIFGPLTKAKLISEMEVTPKMPNTGADAIGLTPETTETAGRPTSTSSALSVSPLLHSVKSLYATPIDGIVTTGLIALILMLTAATLRNSMKRRSVEKDLASAKISALTVLKDLQSEKWRLAEAKAKDEALLESIGEGVIATDPDGKLIIINKAAEELLQFTSRELIGKSFMEQVLLEDNEGKQVETALQPIALAQTAGKSTTAAYYFVRKDGTRFPVAITATPVLLNGKPNGAMLVFRDITKEKEIEKLRTDFLTLASHQLRTPLSGTKWLIETMQRGIIGKLNLRQKKYLDNLYQINERMIMLVSDMLNALMLESGTTVFVPTEVSVTALCDELLLMMKPVAKNRGVTLQNQFQGHKDIILYSDAQSLRSILECFVGNAINYSQVGQKVNFNVTEKPNENIFSVTDSGIGIPKDEQGNIFERFYRSSNAKEFKPDGTGLGLYTAMLLAQNVKGEIYFESKENSGTTFYLSIPKLSIAKTNTP